MEDLVSFTDVPDSEKIRILLESNARLRGKLKAEEIEVKSLLDENDRLRYKLSKINDQQSQIDSLKSKLRHFQNSFQTKPKKVILNMPVQVSAYLNSKGLDVDFADWYLKLHNKSKSL